jgi:hypothetical protein
MRVKMSPSLDLTVLLAEGLGIAAIQGSKLMVREVRRKMRGQPTPQRVPGETTPMWNVVAEQVRVELMTCQRGGRVRLARFLGVPKQRVTDYIRGKRRMPDAETTLRMIYWLTERKAGRDPSI